MSDKKQKRESVAGGTAKKARAKSGKPKSPRVGFEVSDKYLSWATNG